MPIKLPSPSNLLHSAAGLARGPAIGAAAFQAMSRNRKLAPIVLVPAMPKPRPIAHGPYVSSTYSSIAATCADSCVFKTAGCYVRAGATKSLMAQLDSAAAGHTADEVVAAEVLLIDQAFASGVPQDGACGGRDLRLHVGGDILTTSQALMLAAPARRWRSRGGGSVWAFTHSWRNISRTAWGEIEVLASVEVPADIEVARAASYGAATLVDKFPSKMAFHLPGSTARIIPCPAETMGATCVQCRLCLDRDLLSMNASVAFEAHGPGASAVRESVIQLKLGKDGAVARGRRGR